MKRWQGGENVVVPSESQHTLTHGFIPDIDYFCPRWRNRTFRPGLRHWFQAGPSGAVVSEFSTRSTDENDLFDDVRIQRLTQVV